MSDSLHPNQQEILQSFSGLHHWEDRYRKIMDWGKTLPPMPAEYKEEKFLVKGCQSQVWLKVDLESDNTLTIQVDSDALIVKGLAALVRQAYNGLTATEVLNTPPLFINELGLNEHLSPSRANGFAAMIRQIQLYAQAFHLMSLKK